MSEDPYRPPEHAEFLRDRDLPQTRGIPMLWRLRLGYALCLACMVVFAALDAAMAPVGITLMLAGGSLTIAWAIVRPQLLTRSATRGDGPRHYHGPLGYVVPPGWTEECETLEGDVRRVTLAKLPVCLVAVIFAPDETLEGEAVPALLDALPPDRRLYDGGDCSLTVAGLRLEGVSLTYVEGFKVGHMGLVAREVAGGVLQAVFNLEGLAPRRLAERVLAEVSLHHGAEAPVA